MSRITTMKIMKEVMVNIFIRGYNCLQFIKKKRACMGKENSNGASKYALDFLRITHDELLFNIGDISQKIGSVVLTAKCSGHFSIAQNKQNSEISWKQTNASLRRDNDIPLTNANVIPSKPMK
jgi:hypothetical protein